MFARMDGQMDGWMDNIKTVYPTQTKFVGGYKKHLW